MTRLRVKGATLLKLQEPEATEVAISLLSRVVDEYDHFLEVPWCHELLGDAHRRRGDLRRASITFAGAWKPPTSAATERPG